jgi:hypothetical protein
VAEYEDGERWKELDLLRAEYPSFQPFLYDVMTSLLGFDCSDVQLDIAEYLEHGPKLRMIQAQRGQAKTTITAAYAVWRLIHDPRSRILIVSAGGNMATEIANWVIQIVNGMDILNCLKPDRSAGDRSSVKAFDIHYELKGPEKSPSIACMGITSNMQGRRADILIADDIESSKNSQTEGQRERLRHLTKDFASICSNGDIIYLGTPQSIDSVYNGLFSRGYSIRIWPGRYPTEKELQNYKTFLAPFLRDKLEADPTLQSGGGPTGLRGQAVDPMLLPEDILSKKEIDQGAAYFQLQHMLDTRLMDEDRFPLKSGNLVFMHVAAKSAPMEIHFQQSVEKRVHTPADWPVEEHYYRAASFGDEFAPFSGTHMYVDPAGGGQNGDETAYAVTKFSGGRVFLVDLGGVPGGLGNESMEALTAVADLWKPDQIDVEKNFGNGALASVWQPILHKKHKARIEDVWESGQKELRIIDALEPVTGSNRFIVDEKLLLKDWQECQKYPAEKRASYSFFYQLSRITRDKDSLRHDDRLDAVAGSTRHWINFLRQDTDKLIAQSKKKQYKDMLKDPLGNGRSVPGYKTMMLPTKRAALRLPTTLSARLMRRKF